MNTCTLYVSSLAGLAGLAEMTGCLTSNVIALKCLGMTFRANKRVKFFFLLLRDERITKECSSTSQGLFNSELDFKWFIVIVILEDDKVAQRRKYPSLMISYICM